MKHIINILQIIILILMLMINVPIRTVQFILLSPFIIIKKLLENYDDYLE